MLGVYRLVRIAYWSVGRFFLFSFRFELFYFRFFIFFEFLGVGVRFYLGVLFIYSFMMFIVFVSW